MIHPDVLREPHPCGLCKGEYDAADAAGSKFVAPSKQNRSLLAVWYPPFADLREGQGTHSGVGFGS